MRTGVQPNDLVLKRTSSGAEALRHMRTLGFRTHALLTLAAVAGLVAALGRPWYAPPPAVASAGTPAEAVASAAARWATGTDGLSGWDALGAWGTALAALAALTAAGAVAALVPSLQGLAREAVRCGGSGCLALVAWKVVDTPGPDAALELRQGAFAAAAAALVAMLASRALASAPLRR